MNKLAENNLKDALDNKEKLKNSVEEQKAIRLTDTSKNIVICSDGTGNRGGTGNDTNVWRIFNGIDLNSSKRKQITHYDDGVGTEDFKYFKILGGAFGWGMTRNIIHAYKFLCRNYKAEDEIYLFGFSRGAYTVRALSAFITYSGVIKDANQYSDAVLEKLITQMVKIYMERPKEEGFVIAADYKKSLKQYALNRSKIKKLLKIPFSKLSAERRHWLRDHYHPPEQRAHFNDESYNKAHREFREKRSEKMTACLAKIKQNKGDNSVAVPVEFMETKIKYIGVWDTVSAIGLPFDIGLKWLLEKVFFKFNFRDNRLSTQVEFASHAISIDDQRKTFHPEVWEERDGIDQVFFSGVHSNIGGGYPKQGMSYVALKWMLSEIEAKLGSNVLHFKSSFIQEVEQSADVHEKMYNSRAGLAVYYRFKLRYIDKIKPLKSVKVHISCFKRIARQTLDYNPGNFILNPAQNISIVAEGQSTQLDISPKQDLISKLVAQNKRLLSRALSKAKPTVNQLENVYLSFVMITLLVIASIVTAALPLWSGTSSEDLSANVIVEYAFYPGIFVSIICVFIFLYASPFKKLICIVTGGGFWWVSLQLPEVNIPNLAVVDKIVWLVDVALTPLTTLMPQNLDIGMHYYFEHQANAVVLVVLVLSTLLMRYISLRKKLKKLFFEAWSWLRIK